MIDYQKLAKAQEYYRIRGFKPIEVPWIVGFQAIRLTCPKDGKFYSLREDTLEVPSNTNIGYQVASAEQSFIQLMLDGSLKPGRYQAITPCYRGDVLDTWHQRYFMKVELIVYLGKDHLAVKTAWDSLDRMVNDCWAFFEDSLPISMLKTDTVIPWDQQGSTRDLVTVSGGIELGSYGIREHSAVGTWIYGTGCAEPRLSQAIEYDRNR